MSGLINLLAGFAFATFDFKGKNLLFGLVLFTFMVPIEVTIIPQYLQMKTLGWINTWQGLFIPGLANSMVIFLFRQFFSEIPKDLLDAARVDGASWLRILFLIVVPISKPVLIGAGMVLFISTWNSFFWPL
ncbi:MAG: carbohydrate ABC transporter permease, partial [Chloroflexota bacterium]